MYMNIGIFLWMINFTVFSIDSDEKRVIEMNEEMKFNYSVEYQEDAKIYFEAIRDTFELYSLDKKYQNEKVCRSDQTYLDVGKDNLFANLKRNFDRSCSYVVGNLVIAHISYENISFLDSIKEISGYLFIFNNTAKSISLKNLQIIRGENVLLFKGHKWTLVIANNYFKSKYLEYILMPNLQVILRHDILIYESPGLCYMKMINWYSLTDDSQKIIFAAKNRNFCRIYFNTTEQIQCNPSCPKWTGKQYCWSNSSSDCQKVNDCRNQSCSKNTKCYLNNHKKIESCCNEQCAGGCSGPRNSQCLACKNFNNEGKCVDYCPKQIILKDHKRIKNPDGKLAFHHVCVKKCPVKFFNEYGNCVLNCSKPNTYPINETCVDCPVEGCPKVCLQKNVLINKKVDFLNRVMLNHLENCTIYDGNIIINSLSFEGDNFHDMSVEKYGIRDEDLKKLLKLREIHGYLNVNAGTSSLISLFFLRNLKIIRANNIGSNQGYGLSIMANNNLLFLGLKSLQEVQNGNINIVYNKKLCWTNNLNHKSFKYSGKLNVTGNGNCNFSCHKECDKLYGCWGPKIYLCIRCRNYSFRKIKCVSDCGKIPGFFNGTLSWSELNEKKCQQCNYHCKPGENTCNGPRNDQCNLGCKRYSLQKSCISKCPNNYFVKSSKCLPCHPLCIRSSGNITYQPCTGPNSHLGFGGCRKCNNVILNISNSKPLKYSFKCFNNSHSCPKEYFRFLVYLRNLNFIEKLPNHLQSNTKVLEIIKNWFDNKTNPETGFGSLCLPCHPLCSKCNDGSNFECATCKFHKLRDKCVKQCPPNYFTIIQNNQTICSPCHKECDGKCFGSSEYDCLECRHVKIFTNESIKEFFCNNTCGGLHQVVINSEIVCVGKWHVKRLLSSAIQITLIAFAISIAIFCSIIIGICFIIHKQKKKKYNKKHIKMDDYIYAQSESLINVQPNMATLLLITESQLCRSDIIGSGAFGVVYKGIWEPNIDKIDKSNSFLTRNLTKYSKDNSIKLHVAIKVLTDISDSTNIQLLEEAKVMASVCHPCCLRILGVCLTAHPQLITQFMPLGCLLEFCQKNRSLISDITFLNWSKQIAYGMEYLESKGIIHCDLAARNVLVQSPKQVKITDFGLAKMLDDSQHQYQSKGGRMPIKWLAIECIKYRVFSFKSDVWSFGVTLWEMFTFGEKPFKNVKASEILNYLEKGHRLSQPKICSIDLYSIMVQCWLVEAELRPTFTELTKIFEEMVKNKNRYLLIQNSKDCESLYSRLENDAVKYDEFLQALVSAPQLNPDYESLDDNIDDKMNIKFIKSRYRKMCSYKNSFVNYVNSNSNSYTVEPDEIYDQSLNMWYDYSSGITRLSNTTLTTTVNSTNDTLINRAITADLSDDGYLLPNRKNTSKTKMLSSNYLPITETEQSIFSYQNIAVPEVFEDQGRNS